MLPTRRIQVLMVALVLMLLSPTLYAITAPTFQVDTASTTAPGSYTSETVSKQALVVLPVSLEAATSAMTITVLSKEVSGHRITVGDLATATTLTHTCGSDTRVIEVINRSLALTGSTDDILWLNLGSGATATVGIPIVPLGSSGALDVTNGQVLTLIISSSTSSVPYTILEYVYAD